MWAQKQRKNCFGRRKIYEKADEEIFPRKTQPKVMVERMKIFIMFL